MTIGLLGDLNFKHITHRELKAATELFPGDIEPVWIGTADIGAVDRAREVDGLWVIPGTPYANDDAVYAAIRNARETDQPFLGTCGGFQYASIEFARNVAGLEDAAHGEVEPSADQQVVQPLSCSLVAQEREVTVLPDTQLYQHLGVESFNGYHYCNYGLSDEYLQEMTEHGLRVSATAADAGVEAIELPGHAFFIATLFQPQVGASSGRPLNPLITAFCRVAGTKRDCK